MTKRDKCLIKATMLRLMEEVDALHDIDQEYMKKIRQARIKVLMTIEDILRRTDD